MGAIEYVLFGDDQTVLDKLGASNGIRCQHLEALGNVRLGKALGVDGVEPGPSAIPGGAGRNAVADLRNQVLGMQDVYLGAGTEGALGISDLLRGVSEEADQRTHDPFTATLDAIDRLQEPLQSTLVSNLEPALAVHHQVEELRRALNTEVVSLLGVTVGFVDTDGDGDGDGDGG